MLQENIGNKIVTCRIYTKKISYSYADKEITHRYIYSRCFH